jgi:hypothetical protein
VVLRVQEAIQARTTTTVANNPRRKVLPDKRTIAVFILLAAPAFGQLPEPPSLLVSVAHPPVDAATPAGTTADTNFTLGYRNGRLWQSVTSNFKTFYLTGFSEAFNLYSSNQPDFASATIGDAEKGLDRFYQEPENLMFPVITALRFFAMKLNGASQVEVEAEVKRCRTIINAGAVPTLPLKKKNAAK